MHKGHDHAHPTTQMQHMQQMHYARLLAMVVVSFLAMYALMYAMVNELANVFANVNQFYMAGLMTAPMLLIELALMGMMYPNKKLNAVLAAMGVLALVLCWWGIRAQAGVGDRQFLRSMIPHHAGAILMCGQASITDAEIQALCRGIMSGQQKEIDQMKAKLAELDD